jgi:hypothetical protein
MHIRMQRKRNRGCGTKVRLTSAHQIETGIETVEAGGRAEWGAGGCPDGSDDRGQWWLGRGTGDQGQWQPASLRRDMAWRSGRRPGGGQGGWVEHRAAVRVGDMVSPVALRVAAMSGGVRTGGWVAV